MIGLDVFMIRSSRADEELLSMTKNVIGSAKGVQKETKELAARCSSINKDVCILVGKQFKDGFNPNDGLNGNDRIIRYILTFQPIDSTIDDSVCTCPVSVGHKSNESRILE